jgi:hypothetical protein
MFGFISLREFGIHFQDFDAKESSADKSVRESSTFPLPNRCSIVKYILERDPEILDVMPEQIFSFNTRITESQIIPSFDSFSTPSTFCSGKISKIRLSG